MKSQDISETNIEKYETILWIRNVKALSKKGQRIETQRRVDQNEKIN